MISDIFFLLAINCAGLAVVLVGYVFGLDYFSKVSEDVHIEFEAFVKEKEKEQLHEMTEAGDYWDGEDIDYDTGEIGADARASVRHPKNRDRAYSGSVERFHDGGR